MFGRQDLGRNRIFDYFKNTFPMSVPRVAIEWLPRPHKNTLTEFYMKKKLKTSLFKNTLQGILIATLRMSGHTRGFRCRSQESYCRVCNASATFSVSHP